MYSKGFNFIHNVYRNNTVSKNNNMIKYTLPNETIKDIKASEKLLNQLYNKYNNVKVIPISYNTIQIIAQ